MDSDPAADFPSDNKARRSVTPDFASTNEEPVYDDTHRPDNQDDDDDLFGDDDNDNNNEHRDNIDAHQHPGSDPIDDDNEDYIDEDQQEDPDLKQENIEIARHPASHIPSKNENYLIQLPNFLSVDPKQFERDKVLKKLEREASNDNGMMNKLIANNTIRWRYVQDSGSLKKQSNAHFIEWDDGSLSLKIGSEFFDVITSDLNDNFLVVRHWDTMFLQTNSIFTKTMKFTPSSVSSLTHRKLALFNKRKNVGRKAVAEEIDIEEDPLKEIRELEEQEAINDKKLRREKLKKLQQEERELNAVSYNARSSKMDDYNGENDLYDETMNYKDINEYDDEDDDDFVANDEEEIEQYDEGSDDDLEKAERLRRIKESGTDLYSKRPNDSRGETGYDERKNRKKRRVIDSESEDDY
ncbi:Paf1-complex subunit LEO1 [Ascoidea rubescens DSM 1968]|uniref:Leo1-domain-containing protein n=1 Tax=Ascoidea rubescens DSM 1968 TaxID=1344418 RepID=A0A1D2VKS0_9ASCO|nr:Leo1-domain-containing protein [Ascoidea rubescens DSM 1968]ODV62213.1 Leo1-domain-containing protein [Ascoidea rubescens DSM 1968]